MQSTWVMHSSEEIVPLSLRALAITLGAMEVERNVSDKDKWERKKHIGLPRPAGLDGGNNQEVIQ